MSDISLIEWIVYGFVAYVSLLMLIISSIKEVPTTRSLAGLRAIFLVPGIICAGILASSGVNIVFQTVNTTTRDLNSSTVWSQVVTTTIPLQNPVWQSVHYMIMIILVIYVLVQIFNVVGKSE
jgi:hypothetical protein